MNARTVVEYALGALLLVVVLSLFVGQVLGQPILLGFVETGSMSPTLEPGDGFVAVPAALAGPIEPGDVVVFEAQTLQGGGLTTHRVVDETSQGFITKGDANAVTDQASGEPPVQREQVVATALQVGGSVVVIPNLGVLVTGLNGALTSFQQWLAITLGTRGVLGTQGLAYILFAVGLLFYLVSVLMASERRPRTRRTTRETGQLNPRLVVAVLTVLLVLVVTASMTVPSGPQRLDVVSSQSDAPGPSVIEAGGSENLTYVVPSNGLVPVMVFLEPATEGVEVSPREVYVPGGQRRNATVTLSVPPETGSYSRTFVEHRYVALLPAPTIRTLYGIHPWAPIVVIDAFLGIGFAGIGFALVGGRSLRMDTRGSRSFLDRLKRRLR